jgi:hypothetical protein
MRIMGFDIVPGRGGRDRDRGASFQSWLGLERREAFEIAAQIVRKYECAASAFHGTQCAGTNRLIKGRPTGTRDGARFSDAVGKR